MSGAQRSNRSSLRGVASDGVPILLLPPSEGKADGGRAGTSWDPDSGRFGRRLGERRRSVADALGAAGGGDAKLLGVSGRHLDRAQSANVVVSGAETLPAWRRYTGVVWEHLGPAALEPSARARIVVVSGLLGLVRGDDPTPEYRLKMGASLSPLGKLARWWQPAVTDALVDLAGRSTSGRSNVLVDLLPQEHRAALSLPSALHERGRALTVHLVDPTGAPGGHAAKAAKGRLAAAILREGLDALDSWTDDRFRVDTA